MAGQTPPKAKVANKAATNRVAGKKPVLLSGGNPQIAKGYGDARGTNVTGERYRP